MTDRIGQLRAEPWLLDQQRNGCCGFAAVLMGMLEHRGYAVSRYHNEIDILYECIISSGNFSVFMGLTNRQLLHRLERRKGMIYSRKMTKKYDTTKSTDRIKSKYEIGDKECDYFLNLALMIAFKHSIKKSPILPIPPALDIWDECKEFSEKFGKFEYGEKLHSGSYQEKTYKDTKGDDVLYFSYKRGDLAMTPSACKDLIEKIYKEGVSIECHHIDHNALIDPPGALAAPNSAWDTTLDNCKTKQGLLNFIDEKGVTKDLLSIVNTFFSKKNTGIILGLTGNKAKNNVPDFEKYHFVTHWVYLPYNLNKTGTGDFEVYTHGKKHTLSSLANSKGFIPTYAILFQLTK